MIFNWKILSTLPTHIFFRNGFISYHVIYYLTKVIFEVNVFFKVLKRDIASVVSNTHLNYTKNSTLLTIDPNNRKFKVEETSQFLM